MTVSTDPPIPVSDNLQTIADADNTLTCDDVVALNDPPPPYPSSDRRAARHARRITVHGIHTTHHRQFSSSDSQHERSSPISPGTHLYDDLPEPSETTLLLAPPISRRVGGRPRSYSHGSNQSAVPSLAQTVISLFQTEDGLYFGDEHEDRSCLTGEPHDHDQSVEQTRSHGFFSIAGWKRYFRPLIRKAYYSSFLHLAVINFPYALAAWLYLFVFTVTGTTLLIALPLGAVLCFCNLLGARAFSRGELAIQSRFHYPLSYPPPYPPRPIFTRYREPTLSEVESGRVPPRALVREASFYKNTYAMFTDSTSYQALFYFLVIKPAITLLLTILVWVFAVPAFLLILPAPAFLRAIRRLGIWQANIAIEGLYLVVR